MNIKKLILLLFFILLSIYFIIDYGNFFLAINTFNADQVSGNISDMNCLLQSPINNIIIDFKSLINISLIPDGCNVFYTKFSYIKNLLLYITLNYILIALLI